MSLRSSKQHTTKYGRVVYNRKRHIMYFRDRVRLLEKTDVHGETLEEMLRGLSIVFLTTIRLLRTTKSYYLENYSDFVQLLPQINELLQCLYDILIAFGAAALEDFKSTIKRIFGIISQ
jgi:hypothetical protein